MRRPLRIPLFLIAVLTLAVAGCGGGKVTADEVPGGPPTLTVPSDDSAGGSATQTASNSSSSKSGTSNDGNSTSTQSGSAEATPTATPNSTGGSTAATPVPTTAPDTATNDQQPPAGSDAQKFEDFCKQNAGAC
jgi:cytoskeletal protein RodZ